LLDEHAGQVSTETLRALRDALKAFVDEAQVDG
jgi:hypothetical protein